MNCRLVRKFALCDARRCGIWPPRTGRRRQLPPLSQPAAFSSDLSDIYLTLNTQNPHAALDRRHQAGRNVRQPVRPKRSIYSPADIGGPDWLTTEDIEERLRDALVGENLLPFAIRSRSKHVKAKVCDALGYPVPASFARTSPRFPAQDLDVYVQQSNNLQIWNQEVSPNRRYAIVRPN